MTHEHDAVACSDAKYGDESDERSQRQDATSHDHTQHPSDQCKRYGEKDEERQPS